MVIYLTTNQIDGLQYEVDTEAGTRTLTQESYVLPEVTDGETADVVGAAAEFVSMKDTEQVNPPSKIKYVPRDLTEVGRIAMAESGAGEVVVLESQVQFLTARSSNMGAGIDEAAAVTAVLSLFGILNDIIDFVDATFGGSGKSEIGWYFRGRRMGAVDVNTARSIQRAVRPGVLRTMRFFSPSQNKQSELIESIRPDKGGFNLFGWHPPDLWPFS